MTRLIFFFSIFVISVNILTGCSSINSNKYNSENGSELASEPGPYESNNTQSAAGPSVVAYKDYKDPIEPFNRTVFKFNDFVYRYFLSPVSKGYRKILPDPVETGISNFFYNLREPLYFLNNLFQAKPAKSGKNLLRLGINSTVGILGIFDPAHAWWGIEDERATFADMLAYHGVGYGAYIVLPVIGPSDLRNGASMTFQYFMHPLNFIADDDTGTYLIVYDKYHDMSPDLEKYPQVIGKTDDPYLFLRNMYLQSLQRDADVIRQSKPFEIDTNK